MLNAAHYEETPLHQLCPTKDHNIQSQLAECWDNTEAFARWLIPGDFYKTMHSQRKRMFELIDDETLPKTCIEASRKFGKTTIASAKILKTVVMRQAQFIMVVGASLENVCTYITEPLKQQLMDNELIRDVFVPKGAPGFHVKEFEGVNMSFGKKGWYVSHPITGKPACFILPKGMEQSFRGARIRINGVIYRPQLIYVDDVEKDEEVESFETRRKIRRKFNGALMNCVSDDAPCADGEYKNRWKPDKLDPMWRPPWRVIYADTPKHIDANIRHIKQYTDWKYECLPRVYEKPVRTDSSGRVVMEYFSAIPEIYSHAQARNDVAIAKEDPSGVRWAEFRKEVMCEVDSQEDKIFFKEMFQYYSEDDADSPAFSRECSRFIVCDPAKTGRGRACTAITAWACNPNAQKIYLRGLVNERIGGGNAYKAIVDACLKWNTRIVFLEVTGVEDVGPYVMQTELAKRGLQGKVRVHEIFTQRKKMAPTQEGESTKNSAKRARLRTFLPFYQSRHVWHENSIRNSAYEQQLLAQPEPPAWDAADCGGHVPAALEAMRCYFSPIVQPFKKVEAFVDDNDEFDECGRFFADEENWVEAI